MEETSCQVVPQTGSTRGGVDAKEARLQPNRFGTTTMMCARLVGALYARPVLKCGFGHAKAENVPLSSMSQRRRTRW